MKNALVIALLALFVSQSSFARAQAPSASPTGYFCPNDAPVRPYILFIDGSSIGITNACAKECMFNAGNRCNCMSQQPLTDRTCICQKASYEDDIVGCMNSCGGASAAVTTFQSYKTAFCANRVTGPEQFAPNAPRATIVGTIVAQTTTVATTTTVNTTTTTTVAKTAAFTTLQQTTAARTTSPPTATSGADAIAHTTAVGSTVVIAVLSVVLALIAPLIL
ncbi:hypothetical protein BJ742DRAFT_789314 [Cladochytrium replicatum]|nr:hypothetical protein BJ742DRAFT_789314 [Cladochytrium replicatum]